MHSCQVNKKMFSIYRVLLGQIETLGFSYVLHKLWWRQLDYGVSGLVWTTKPFSIVGAELELPYAGLEQNLQVLQPLGRGREIPCL